MRENRENRSKRGEGERQCAKRAPKRRRVKCARRERAADTSAKPRVLASSLLRCALLVRVGVRPSLLRRPSPPCPPSHHYAALCKSPHMLPRVPVSQRHSRALFRTFGSAVRIAWRAGRGDKTLFLSLSLSTSRTGGQQRERDTHVTTDTARTGTRERERSVCACACMCVCVLCACVCTLRVYACARDEFPFQCLARSRRDLVVESPRSPEGRRAVNRVA